MSTKTKTTLWCLITDEDSFILADTPEILRERRTGNCGEPYLATIDTVKISSNMRFDGKICIVTGVAPPSKAGSDSPESCRLARLMDATKSFIRGIDIGKI